MRLKLFWLWMFAFLLCSQITMGQSLVVENDTTYTLYFHVGKYDFDPLFRSNAKVMNRIVDQIDLLCSQPSKAIRSIKVSTSTSPEGGKKLNVNLASNRSNSIVRYLMLMYPRLTQQIVISSELAPDWNMLRDLVSGGEMPMKEEALEILNLYRNYYTPDYSIVDPRETKLMQLQNGKVWRYMLDNYFPDMRYAKVELLHDFVDTSSPLIDEIVAPKEVTVVEPEPEPEPEPIIIPQIVEEDTVIAEEPIVSDRKFLFALKTNVLFDAICAFNGAIEFPIAKHWSVQAEAIWPWYVHSHDWWCYQAGILDGELRYWLGGQHIGNPIDEEGKRNPLTGHYLSLTGGFGYYDISDHQKGHQGEMYIVGLNYGYSRRLWHNFNLEFSLGVGYVRSNYRRYHVNEVNNTNYLVRKYHDHFNWFGPIKANISLSWLIFNKRR